MKIEYNKKSEAHLAYKSLFSELYETYTLHRGIAKLSFRKDAGSLKMLAINGRKPKAYEESMLKINSFYVVAAISSEVQSILARFLLTPEKLKSAKKLITSVEAARRHYIREKLNAQKATKLKNRALSELTDWMKDFYAVAKMAVEDHSMLH